MGQGDLEAALETLAPDVEFVNPPYAVEPGTRYGHEGFGRALDRLQETVDIATVDVEELANAGDRVVAVVRATGRGRGTGIPVDTRIVHVWTLRDGLIARLEWFLDADEGYAVAGIPRDRTAE